MSKKRKVIKRSSTEALMTAVAKADLARVRAYIAAGVTLATKRQNAVTQAARAWWGDSDKPLAARLTLLRELIAAGCPVEGQALFAPIDRDEVEIVRFLIDHGADVNVVEKGQTPLGAAIHQANRSLANFFVEGGHQSRATADADDARQLKIIRALIKAGANVNQVSGPLLGFGYTKGQVPPIHTAVNSDHPEVIRLLHQAGADVNVVDKNKYTPLLRAAEMGHLDAVKALIAAGAKVNKPGLDGWTPLALANEHKDRDKDKPYQEIIQALKAASARVPAAFQLKEDFIKAAANGDLQRVNQFIAGGVDLDACSTFDCRTCTALALAAEAGHLDVVDALLAAGATVDAQDYGRTPLFYAAQAGRAEVVRKLLHAGANTEVTFKEVYEGFVTPLVMAAEEGHLEVVRDLLKAGANVSHRARSGKTAMTAAADYGHTEVVGVLVEAFKRTRKDLRLLDYALWRAVALGNAATVKLLLDAGVSPHAATTMEGRIVSALQIAKRQGHKSKIRLLEAALKAPVARPNVKGS